MKSSVIVCTYEAPRELDFVLAALSRQTRMPDEILVADDGSETPTRDVVDHWRARMPCPLHHVHQADIGYRKARIVNEAVRRSIGDHLLMLDGDSFPHRAWVDDHVSVADGRTVLCGRRVKLGPKFSAAMTREDIVSGHFDSVFTARFVASTLSGDTKRLFLGLRLPMPLVRVLHPRPRKLMGVNFSLPRGAFYAVNGHDEAWVVYGHEDRDIELRLKRAGYPFRPLLNRAVVFHMWHRERERTEKTRDLLRSIEESKRMRCTRGLTGCAPFDPDM